MLRPGRPGRLSIAIFVSTLLIGCTVQLVAPYDADLQQKASAMQAEVAAWDLTMRGNAGTVAADPRNPELVATLNKWRGEGDAMLTLAISNDPNTVGCSDALKATSGAIESAVPATLREALPSPAPAAQQDPSRPLGCEAAMVANIETGIDDIEKALKFCRASWIPDSYFTSRSQDRVTAPGPPKPPTPADQSALTTSCLAEFKVAPQLPAAAAGARHGRAVSSLLTTLQAIVYVENRKKAAEASK